MTEENYKRVCLCMVQVPSGSDDAKLLVVNVLLWRVC